ncbi:MAG: UDPGP type 1 family protein [Erysipelotrichaceae bacterium]|nr:UDPGP type 1 family protein [Erysipelotrichaceae bacterium]
MDRNKVIEKLEKYHQLQLLKYENELNEVEKDTLYQQIMYTDFSVIERIGRKVEKQENRKIEGLDCLEVSAIEAKKDIYKATGIKAIQEGKVAAVLLAGGQGTRLGFDHSKGMFNIGVNKELYIFEQLIHNLKEVTDEAGAYVPFYIMCSDKNYEEITAFFQEHDYFGYPVDYLGFYKQDMAPSTDFNGKIYLEGKGKLSLSPNGNGGWFTSLDNAGLLKDATDRGVEWLNVFGVDNVLVKIADPIFTGAIIEEGYVSGSKVVRKKNKEEKVGNLCLADGKPAIVEYFEMTPELLDMKKANGDLVFNFGVILNYNFRIDKLVEIMNKEIPVHVVTKKIPYLDEAGNLVKPEEPNGHKFEQMITDQVHLMDNCLPFEVVREKEFAPVKNATGVDSVESARGLLQLNGIEI